MESYEREIMSLSGKHQRLETLMHYVNKENLIKEHRMQNGSKAVGIDGVTKQEYGSNLDENIESLLSRMKSFSYRPQSVKRVYIPKANGKLRPLGISAYEDKLVQGVMARVLSAVYEPRFMPFSYGFRPQRSAHDAVKAIWQTVMTRPIGWMVEADIKSFFNNMDHGWLMEFLRQDIRDENFLRYIVRFLKAGVIENHEKVESDRGSEQGNLMSPVLANVYLHYVLDKWFESVVKPRMRGEAFLCRYADDFLALFQYEDDARRFYEVLPKRLAKFGLEIAKEKTRILPFGRFSKGKDSFDFLGFTFINGKSQKGDYCVIVHTSKKKLKAKRLETKEWLRSNMHVPLCDLVYQLNIRLRGHYRYYGVSFNSKSLSAFRFYCVRILYWIVNKRGGKHRRSWEDFKKLLISRPVLSPRISVKLW